MTDIRDTLNEIQQRADAASRMLMTGSKPWLVRDSAIDVPRLLAALRAVLDFTTADKTPIWVGIALDEMIAEALGCDQ